MDPVGELNIGILMRENDVLWLSFACQDMKRAAICHRGNPKLRRQAIVHIQIPDEHFPAEPSKRCRDMRRIRRLRYPSYYVNLQEKRKTLPLSGTSHRLLYFPFWTAPSMRTSSQ